MVAIQIILMTGIKEKKRKMLILLQLNHTTIKEQQPDFKVKLAIKRKC